MKTIKHVKHVFILFSCVYILEYLLFLREYVTQSDLQIQCNSCLNPNDDFGRNRKTHPKIHVDTQVTLNNQSKLEKEEQNWRINTC